MYGDFSPILYNTASCKHLPNLFWTSDQGKSSEKVGVPEKIIQRQILTYKVFL
jgi:hypothetical protein